MRIVFLVTILLSQTVLANSIKDDEYAGVHLGSTGDSALGVLKNYQSGEDLYEEPESCFYLSPNANLDGPHIMVMDGVVVRFEVDEQDSKIKTEKGIGIDSTRAEVLAAYDNVKASVHPYLGEEAEYLEVKLANGYGLIFETYQDKVTSFRLGSYPAVLYIEGCA
ncbi:MAG: hypothetical protein ABJV04_18575 [Aliiglaciecola sp.]|uniref:hypothetical protein n=1 Tax=Aliiglaciecola sp. TaxID=1872441 RepID=UPI003299078E